MSEKKEVHVGDIGTVFRLTLKEDDVVVDISAATVKKLIFELPDGTSVEKTAAFTTDGTDGKIEWPAPTGFLTPGGMWKLQARVEYSNGDKWSSSIVEIRVYPNL